MQIDKSANETGTVLNKFEYCRTIQKWICLEIRE